MSLRDQNRIRELLRHLEELDTRRPSPSEASIYQIARDAIIDELTRLARSDSLALYRQGKSLQAIVL
jgi:hypothetical protein